LLAAATGDATIAGIVAAAITFFRLMLVPFQTGSSVSNRVFVPRAGCAVQNCKPFLVMKF
jgi:hypothetical protein